MACSREQVLSAILLFEQNQYWDVNIPGIGKATNSS